MNKVVVDSSVAIKWFFAEPYSSEAGILLKEYKSGTVLLLAPDLIYAEVGNVVWKKQRFQGISVADAQDVIEGFQSLSLVVTSSADLLGAAYRLAVAHQRTVYDALYLALCVREQCAYVSADEKLVNAVRPALSNVVWVADWS
jgi:predicted nucleic acid-binding protein